MTHMPAAAHAAMHVAVSAQASDDTGTRPAPHAPTQPPCCQAMTGCGVAPAVGVNVHFASSASGRRVAPITRRAFLSSLEYAPEPPPPKA